MQLETRHNGLHRPDLSGRNRYHLVETLQRGGMGEVVLAEVEDSTGWRSRVVLKRLLADLLEDERYVSMFVAEAQVMARLNHPNIVRLYDTPIIEGVQCLALEYVHGKNVYQMIKRCRALGITMPARVALRIAAEILQGLHYAHQFVLDDGLPLELVHRDVTPGNLLVSFDGDVKITDFGISKSKMSQTSTTVGIVKGTTRYLSPEQIRGAPASVRSDLFSTALVLVEMMTGRAIFDRGSVPATLFAIAAGERKRIAELLLGSEHARLAAVLERALSTDPERRHQTAAELGLDLAIAASELGPPVDRAGVAVFVRDLFPEHHEPLGAFEAADSNASGLDHGDLTYLFEVRDPVEATDEAKQAEQALRSMAIGGRPLEPEQFRGGATALERLPRESRKVVTAGGDDAAAVADAFDVSGPRSDEVRPSALVPAPAELDRARNLESERTDPASPPGDAFDTNLPPSDELLPFEAPASPEELEPTEHAAPPRPPVLPPFPPAIITPSPIVTGPTVPPPPLMITAATQPVPPSLPPFESAPAEPPSLNAGTPSTRSIRAPRAAPTPPGSAVNVRGIVRESNSAAEDAAPRASAINVRGIVRETNAAEDSAPRASAVNVRGIVRESNSAAEDAAPRASAVNLRAVVRETNAALEAAHSSALHVRALVRETNAGARSPAIHAYSGGLRDVFREPHASPEAATVPGSGIHARAALHETPSGREAERAKIRWIANRLILFVLGLAIGAGAMTLLETSPEQDYAALTCELFTEHTSIAPVVLEPAPLIEGDLCEDGFTRLGEDPAPKPSKPRSYTPKRARRSKSTNRPRAR